MDCFDSKDLKPKVEQKERRILPTKHYAISPLKYIANFVARNTLVFTQKSDKSKPQILNIHRQQHLMHTIRTVLIKKTSNQMLNRKKEGNYLKNTTQSFLWSTLYTLWLERHLFSHK